MTQELFIRGEKFTVTLNRVLGLSTTFDGKDVTASNRGELESKLSAMIKEARADIAVPIVASYNGKFQRMFLRGKHAKTGEWLLTTDDGEKVSASSLADVAPSDAISTEELHELNAALHFHREAYARLRKAKEKLQASPGAILQHAYSKLPKD